MKILSQLMNAVPDATAKPLAADASKGSLQSSFASVIGAAAAAAGPNGDAKLSKAQNVDTKKTSSPESARKSTSPSTADVLIALPVADVKVPVTPVVPVVPQVVVQPESDSLEKEDLTSTTSPVVLKSSIAEAVSTITKTGPRNVTTPNVPIALPKIATSDIQGKSSISKVDTATNQTRAAVEFEGNNTATHTITALAQQIDSASTPIATAAAPEVNTASSRTSSAIALKVDTGSVSTASAITRKVDTELVSTATAIAPKVSSEPLYTASVSAAPIEAAVTIPSKRAVSLAIANLDSATAETEPAPVATVPVKTATIDTTSANAVNAGIANSNTANAKATSTARNDEAALNPALLQVQTTVPLPVAIPSSTNVLSPLPVQASVVSPESSLSPSVSNVAPAPKTSISNGVVKQASAGVASTLPGNGPVATAAPNSSPEPVSVSHIQIGRTATVPPSPVIAQPLVTTPATETNAVSAPQPAEASVTAVTQQVETVAVAVPQQIVLQSADAAAVPSSASTFKIADGKSEAAGVPSNLAPVASKSRASASDWRLNRNFATSDGKASAADTDGVTVAPHAFTPVDGAKETPGNLKGVLESATPDQSSQAAQVAGPISPAPAPVTSAAATQDASAAANTNLPSAPTSAESTQAAHALNSAQLIQSVHGSEMRLGMQSAEFGNISINTSLNHQTLSAQISMDHTALGHALAMHLPAIEEKLGSAYGLQAKVELRDTANNSAASDSSSSESRGDRRSQGGGTGTSAVSPQSPIGTLTSSNFTPSSTSMAAGTSRLDIRI